MADFPLSRDELIAIRDGNKRNADVKALLREIKRQHSVILEAESCRQAISGCPRMAERRQACSAFG